MRVVIPTCNRRDLIDRTLRSLATCVLPDSYEGTLVVENGPKTGVEGVVAAVRSELQVEYLHVPEAGKSHALNVALGRIEHGLVVFFDDDVRLEADVLVRYEEASRQAGTGAFFGGSVQIDYETAPPYWLLAYLPCSARGMDIADDYYQYFLGANWAAFAEDILDAGGFRVDIGAGTESAGEETEMQVRLERQGAAKVKVPQALVWHYVPEERCSPEWAVDRQYKMGAASGLNLSGARVVFGVPRWALKAGVKNIVRAALDLRAEPAHRRWRLRYHLTFLRGLVRGAWQHRRPVFDRLGLLRHREKRILSEV